MPNFRPNLNSKAEFTNIHQKCILDLFMYNIFVPSRNKTSQIAFLVSFKWDSTHLWLLLKYILWIEELDSELDLLIQHFLTYLAKEIPFTEHCKHWQDSFPTNKSLESIILIPNPINFHYSADVLNKLWLNYI